MKPKARSLPFSCHLSAKIRPSPSPSLGCGFSFLASWAVAGVLSALLAPLFGQSQGGNTAVGTLLSGLTCGGSLLMGAALSFLTGRLFPIFGKKAG